MKDSFYGIAVEGWPIVLVAVALAGWLVISPWPALAILPALLFLFAIGKFRDPQRDVSSDPLGVLSPVDGDVVDIDQGPDGRRILLHIGMFSPYLFRSPTEGKVLETGEENGGHGLRIRTDEGGEVRLRLMGPRWLPSAASIGYGERVGQGQRCGMLRTARVVEIWLPVESTLAVQRGDRVLAGETVLGRFRSERANERSPARAQA